MDINKICAVVVIIAVIMLFVCLFVKAGVYLKRRYPRSQNTEGGTSDGLIRLKSAIRVLFGKVPNINRTMAASPRDNVTGTGSSTRAQNRNRPMQPSLKEDLTDAGSMIYLAKDRYGQRDKEYRFHYKKVNDGWRAYILRMPDLGGRSNASGTIHRLHDNNGYYICWNSNVRTLKDMQIISRAWADNIQNYIATGRFG